MKKELSVQQEITDEFLNHEYIEAVEDHSDGLAGRARVVFKNGHQLSVIYGPSIYGFTSGTFEIAPFHRDTGMDGSLFDEVDQGDVVLGYCTKDKVLHYVRKIGLMEVKSDEEGRLPDQS